MLRSDDALPPHRDPFLKNFLEEERRRVVGSAEERKEQLRSLIDGRESELADDYRLDRLFESHLADLPKAERPQTRPQERRLFNKWEGTLKQELDEWRKELARLESQHIDGQLIFDNARDRMLRLLEAEAIEAGLLPQTQIWERAFEEPVEERSTNASLNSGPWMTFAQLEEYVKRHRDQRRSIKPSGLQYPDAQEISVKYWANLLKATCEWLIMEGLLTRDVCPVKLPRQRDRIFIDIKPEHPDGRKFGSKQALSNGLYVETKWPGEQIASYCEKLISEFGRDPTQFHVRLSQ